MTPKPMSAEVLAGEIYIHGKHSDLPWSYKFVLERIKQAEQEAVMEDRKIWDEQHDLDLKLQTQESYERGVKETLGIQSSVADLEREAYIRGKLDGLKEGDSCTAKSMEIARDAGLEEAAKVAEIWVIWTPEHVQQFIRKIRSLKSEGKL